MLGLNEFEELMHKIEKSEPALFNDDDYHFKLAAINVQVLILNGLDEIREGLEMRLDAMLRILDTIRSVI